MNTTFKLKAKNFQLLLSSLRDRGYRTIGPTVSDGAIVYDEFDSIDMLPIGWSDEQEAGSYRLKKHKSETYFAFGPAPQSWKRYLFPPRKNLFTVYKNGKTMEVAPHSDDAIKYAFIGVHPCELAAMKIQDKIFGSDEYGDESYKSIRRNLFIVTVDCTESRGTCFCSSMKTGPRAQDGYDISLTEVVSGKDHCFIARSGSDHGTEILATVEATPASEEDVSAAEGLVAKAEADIKRKVETDGLPQILADNLDHARWDAVSARCLTCGNCTLVCPTCFCCAVEDSTDLSGQSASRIRSWDSCFTVDFAKVAGGNYRITPKSRYRQWLTHKFSSWVGQFGTFGCVGCGRCITWCPVGIDITAEIQAIRGAKTQ